ncbi:MAG: hypothetical protein PHH81_03045 [Bacteroides graminisolvens]|nr:hypothetical protein [Bacteroides graminisolvens]
MESNSQDSRMNDFQFQTVLFHIHHRASRNHSHLLKAKEIE